jgi:hypothetical protein
MPFPIQQQEGYVTRFNYGVVSGGHTLTGSADAISNSPGVANYLLSGTYWINSSGVDAITLVQPVAGGGLAPSGGVFPALMGQDEFDVLFYALTAHAHTITTASATGINNSVHIATFAAAVGNYIRFKAKTGIWYVLDSKGITLS